MIIIPAIDIKDGKVVRLLKGRFEDITVYSEDPVSVAKKWEAQGAKMLHVVDLDGALSGESKNFEVITRLVNSVKIPVQLGGGIRKEYDIARFLAGGISRVILGTRAIEDREFLKKVLDEWKEKVILSVDATNGILAQRGWTESSNLKVIDFLKEVEPFGVSCLIYTDISRDGTLTGPNIKGIEEILKKIKIPLIASGGISGIKDIKNLLKLKSQGLAGVIVGKSIYEGRLDLKEAIALCLPKG